MAAFHYERIKIFLLAYGTCLSIALADQFAEDYKTLISVSNKYLWTTNDSVKAEVAWTVERHLDTYQPVFLATMGLPGELKKFFVYVEAPFMNTYSSPGLDTIRVTVFDYFTGSACTPLAQREFQMESRSHIDGVQIINPGHGLGEVLVINALYGGSLRPLVRGVTYWTLEAKSCGLPVFRQISCEGETLEPSYRVYGSPEEAALYNKDGFSPADWGRNVTNQCVSLRIRSLYELGCSYDFPNQKHDAQAVELRKEMAEVRLSLFRDGTISNLATNDLNPWVRAHAQKLLLMINMAGECEDR
jgi:hypothetical protein